MASIVAFPARRWLHIATGMNVNTWYAEVMRGVSCAAFGAAQPLLESQPLGVDAFAVCARNELAGDRDSGGLSLALAAAIVRGFPDRLLEAVSHAEHDQQDTCFVVAETEHGRRNWNCAAGPSDKLGDFIAGLPRPVRRVVVVHPLEVLAGIRARCRKNGLDLSGSSFSPPPDHPLLTETAREWTAWRQANAITGPRAKFPKATRAQRERIAELLQ